MHRRRRGTRRRGGLPTCRSCTLREGTPPRTPLRRGSASGASSSATGHVALYRFEPERDLVRVLRIRHQREAGYRS